MKYNYLMENIVQSDIFFFITSIAVVLVTIFLIVALWYVIRILKDVSDVSEVVKKQAVSFSDDISGVREKIKQMLDALIARVRGKTKKQSKRIINNS